MQCKVLTLVMVTLNVCDNNHDTRLFNSKLVKTVNVKLLITWWKDGPEILNFDKNTQQW